MVNVIDEFMTNILGKLKYTVTLTLYFKAVSIETSVSYITISCNYNTHVIMNL